MPQTTKYLIFDASTEWDSFIGVVECTPEYLALIKKRMALAVKAKEGDSDFAWMRFYDNADLYEGSPATDAWIEENSPEDFVFDRMMVTETKPEFGDDARVRVNMAYVEVDENSCFWEIVPKHSDQVCESQVVRSDMELFAE
jgi:hypothetical protein